MTTLSSAERMSQCSGPRETGHVQRSMLYALEPYILNLSLGLTCYLVVYAISALLSYNEILEITLSVLGILLSGSLPILTGVVRFICLKECTGQENPVCKCDCFDYTIREALMFVLSRCS